MRKAKLFLVVFVLIALVVPGLVLGTAPEQQAVTKVRGQEAGNAGDDNPFTFMFAKDNSPVVLKRLDGTAITFGEVAKLYGNLNDGMQILVGGEEVYYKYNLIPKGIDLSHRWPDIEVPAGILPIDPTNGRFILRIPEFVELDKNNWGFAYASQSRDLEIADNYAYVLEDNKGLKIIDITNPKSPKLINSVKLNDKLYKIRVIDEYAFIAAEKKGLFIIDVSNPNTPGSIVNIGIDGDIKALDVALNDKDGGYVYVGKIDGNLQIIKLEWDKISKRQMAELERWNYTIGDTIRHIQVIGDYAYLSADNAGLHIVDISKPAGLKGTSFKTKGLSKYVDVVGKYAYVALRDKAGLQIVDISDPLYPKEAGYYNEPNSNSSYYCVRIVGHYAFVADFDGNYGLKVINVTQPNNPSLEDVFFERGAQTLRVVNGYVYITHPIRGLFLTVPTKFESKPIPSDISLEVDYNW